jgi:hypothetical protein
MNYTETQKRLLDELANEFNRLNQSQSNNEFSLINIGEIIDKENEHERLIKEIELHNKAMNKLAMQQMFDIAKKLDADFKKAGVNLKCFFNEEDALKYQTPRTIKIKAIDESGKELDTCISDIIFIEFSFTHEQHVFDNRTKYKYVNITYGNGNKHYKTIEDYLNTQDIQIKFGSLYRNYCK